MSPGTLAVFVGLVCYQGPAAPDMSDADLYKSVARLTAIPADDRSGEKRPWTGTGFLFGHKGPRLYMLTAAHVVEGAIGVRVDFPLGQKRHVVRAQVDTLHDLALIELNAEAPTEAVSLRAYDGPAPSLNPQPDYRVVGYLLGHPSSTLAQAKLANRFRASEVKADGKYLDAQSVVYQLTVPFTYGGSGGPVVDRAGRVVAVYQGGPWGGALSLNFCVPYLYFAGVSALPAVDMTALGPETDRVADLAANGLSYDVQGFPFATPGALPSSLVIKRVPVRDIFRYFLDDKDDPLSKDIKKSINKIVGEGKTTVNHVVNTRAGFGFLVPEGFELSEDTDRDSKAYTLTIRRPGSHYAARVYSRPILPLKKDVLSEKREFELETLSFLAGVPKVQVNFLDVAPTRPNEAAVAPVPMSWPAVYRDRSEDDLVSLRSYIEPGRALMHSYQIGLCRRMNRAEITGFTAPIAAFSGPEPTEELTELFFLLNTMYDTRLGLDVSKRLRSDPSNQLTEAFKLQTPGGLPGDVDINNQAPFIPAPDGGVPDPRFVPAVAVARPGPAAGAGQGGLPVGPMPAAPVGGGPVIGPPANPGGNGPIGVPPVAPGGPAGMNRPPGVLPVPPPVRGEFQAMNLGVSYELVPLRGGTFGARVTRPPLPGSPATRVFLGPNAPVFLEPGDMILALDGLPVLGPQSLLEHWGPTRVDFIDVRTGQRRMGETLLPTPAPPGFLP